MLQLQTYDVEYVFLQIRAKSVGETSSITIKCEECGHRVPVTINLEDAYVQTSDDFQQEKTIEITDGIGITLEGLSLAKARSIDPNSTDLTKTVKLFIKSIYDTDGVYLASESSDEEIKTFVESLPHKVLEEINSYISLVPTLVIDVKFTCPKCGHNNEIQIKGLASFFE